MSYQDNPRKVYGKVEIVYSDQDWRLDIFGQGEWQEMLEAMIHEYGLTHSAHINIPSKRIGEEYAASSLLVMSSHYEGFPMVMIEAMACGLPVVAFDFKCGPKDIILEGQNGIIVPEGDIPQLAQAITQLIEQEPLRKAMSKEAQEVTNRYSEERIMQQWIDLFTSLVSR